MARPMEEMFKEARLKIERANKHINDLNLILGEFTKRKTHEVIIEHDPHGGDDVLKVKAIQSLPADFVLTLGDAIHNLRTSLDYVMNDIEFITVGKRTTHTKFPAWCETRDALVAAVNGGLKEKAPKQVIDCIVEDIQPYKRGNGRFLFDLHDLDIEDKHRLLITKSEFSMVDGITIENDAGKELNIGTWLVVYGKVAAFPLNGWRNAKVKNQGLPSYSVRFGETLPFALDPVIPTMKQLSILVSGTIDEIEYWFRISQIGI
jgi:hypothetical protein